jgi:hypothetical protein
MKNVKVIIFGTITILIVIAVIVLGGWKAIYYWEDSAGGRVIKQKAIQPIAFNHNLHIENGLECVFCHKYVETMARATIPNIGVCGDCHDPEEPLTDPVSAEEEKLHKYIKEEKKIPWIKIYTVADFVYFSHQRHVTIGKLQCVDCHGDMTKRVKPLSKQLIEIKMQRCIDCHKKSQIAHECISCHR